MWSWVPVVEVYVTIESANDRSDMRLHVARTPFFDGQKEGDPLVQV